MSAKNIINLSESDDDLISNEIDFKVVEQEDKRRKVAGNTCFLDEEFDEESTDIPTDITSKLDLPYFTPFLVMFSFLATTK
jgi:hypothetical protein